MPQELSLAFVGGKVFDGSGADPVRTDVGVVGQHIACVGIDEVALATGPSTRVIQLDGRLLLPAFVDAHVHPIEGGLERLGCDLSGGWTREDYLAIIRDYLGANPGGEWVIGGGWQMAAFTGGFPLAADLDQLSATRPIAVSNRDHHSVWVNSEALRRAGITKDTPDPEDGRIERDADGVPTGTLHEGARMLVLRLAPEPDFGAMHLALLAAQGYLHEHGIASWQDALIGDYGNHSAQEVEVYARALTDGELTGRVNAALWWDRERGMEQLEELEAVRARFSDGRFRVTTIKIMQDGVVENCTAALTSPYESAGCGCGGSAEGLSFIEPAELNRIVTELDARGWQVHFHAIGDRGVRECLDAVEAARGANAQAGLPHHIAHLQVVHPDDVERFERWRVTANIQPLWASYDPQMTALNVPLIGEQRATWQYPFAGILRTGGALAGGSDWPVTTADPWLGVHVAVNRQHPAEHPDHSARVLGEDQRLTLGQALAAYTSGGAAINGWQDEQGRVAPGFLADLVVVDRDPFAGPTTSIARTRTVETFSRGTSVFRAPVA